MVTFAMGILCAVCTLGAMVILESSGGPEDKS